MLGTAVIAGMTLVTMLGVFIIPVLYVAIGRLTGAKQPVPGPGAEVLPPAPAREVHP